MECFKSTRSIECFCAAFDEIPFDRAFLCKEARLAKPLGYAQPMRRTANAKPRLAKARRGNNLT